MKTTSIVLSAELLKEIKKRIAEATIKTGESLSVSAYIRKAIEEKFKNDLLTT